MVRGVQGADVLGGLLPRGGASRRSSICGWRKKLGSEKLQKLVVALAVVLSLGLTIGLL